MKLKLRYLLVAVFTVVATVPAIFLGFWVERTALEKEVSAVREKHLLLARNITAALERYAHDTEAVFRLLAETAAEARPLAPLATVAQQLDFRYFIVIGPADGVQQQLGMMDAADADRALGFQDRIGAPSDGVVAYSPVLADASARPTIYLSQRLDGGRMAVAALATDYIVKLQQAIAFGRKGHAAIVDRDGNIIAHPKADWTREIKNISKVDPVRRMMNGETDVTMFYSPAVKKDMITGFTTVDATGWGVMVPQPFEELEEQAFAVKLIALAVSAAGLATAAVIGWLLAGLVTRPVDAVVGTARTIANGRLDARVPEQTGPTPTEIRELSNGFNAMARQLQEDQSVMARALRDARLADRTKSEFLANISHELRTPLNAIIGFSETMRMEIFGRIDARYKDYAADIQASGQHLLSIINDILDLSKIEAGKFSVEDEPVDVVQLLKESHALVRERAADSNVGLDCRVPDDLPMLRGSDVKLKQVVLNLVSNAIKFTPEGGEVTISIRNDGGKTLVLEVQDTGIGMSAAEIKVALAPFEQVDSRLSRKYEGTGLGLPLAKRLVELHDGTLHIESTPRRGHAGDRSAADPG